MSDKKAKIKDGKNIDVKEEITVINEGISLAEKKEVEAKQEEVSSPAEQKEPEITPDVKITPEVPETPINIEVPNVDINNALPNNVANNALPNNVANDALPDASAIEFPGIQPTNNVDAVQPNFDVGNNDFSQGAAFDFAASTGFDPAAFDFLANRDQNEEMPSNNDVEVNNNEIPVNNVEENNDKDMFRDAYDDLYEKVEATVVTESDAQDAKNAFIDAMNKVYDKGPGRHIDILRRVAEDATKWISEVVEKGFVSGPMHKSAEKIMNDYRGLKPKEEVNDIPNLEGEVQPKFFDEPSTQQFTNFDDDFANFNKVI